MIVLIDERMESTCVEALLERGLEVIALPACDILDSPVSAHPDMLLFVGRGTLICHEKYYAIAKEKIDEVLCKTGLSVILSNEAWDKKYPGDVLFNAAAIGDKVICNKKSVSKHIIDLYGEENVINTRQGYSKCSTCTVGDRAIITADVSIARAVKNIGIDVLLLDDPCTALDGYSTGFIGGATGDDGAHIFFCGNIELHPQAEQIKSFCNKHGRDVVSLSKSPLYDYGTLIFI